MVVIFEGLIMTTQEKIDDGLRMRLTGQEQIYEILDDINHRCFPTRGSMNFADDFHQRLCDLEALAHELSRRISQLEDLQPEQE